VVDHSALRVNQSFIIGLLVLAFVVESTWLAAFVAVVMIVGTVFPELALFKRIYRHVLRARVVQPDVIADRPEPHRFAQGFGGAVLTTAVVALAVGAALFGWVLVWVVIALAAVNLFLGFCVGCFIYYWLARLNVPGFTIRSVDHA
jgi:hypothetical protein